MPQLTDRRLTADEIDGIAQPYVTAMNAIFVAAERRSLEVMESMVAGGASQAEILKAVDDIFA